MAAVRRQWERPATRPITTSDSRADERDVPVTNGTTISANLN
jgi:hypothetical protein